MNVEEEKLLDRITRDYGFKRELIKNPKALGLEAVAFEVNGIRYCGSTCFNGAFPMLSVTGYVTSHYSPSGIPVEDWYYNEYIRGKKARLFRCVDGETGDWEDTGIRFESQREAQEYMDNLSEEDFPYYKYEMIQEEE